MTTPSTIGGRLRDARERAGMTRDVLAKAAGLSADAIEKIEVGRREDPRTHTASLLAAALGISLDWLINGDLPGATGTEG